MPDALVPDLKLAILGKPNAGKSTLFNTLTGKERALISPVAGTTRDSINEFFHFEGKLIEVVDTAGLRRNRNVIVFPAAQLIVPFGRPSLPLTVMSPLTFKVPLLVTVPIRIPLVL